jgi:endonuclease/exonuclease/phosphatase family metal-dependent hydrolase
MRLTSWNLLHGQGAENMRAIAQDLAVGNSDFVIGVQEVDAYQDRSDQVFQVAEIASELSAKYFGFLRCVIGTPGFSWRKVRKDEANLITDALVQSDDKPPSYGIGLITNSPVLNWEVLALGKSIIGLPLVFPDATAGENVRPKIKFIYVKDEPRFALAAQLENGYTVVNMHLSFVPFVNLYQLWKVKRWLAKIPGKHILLGDFNLPFEIPVKFSKWKSLSPMATYPTWQPKIQFDYILSNSKELSSVKAIYLESKISDHLPVTIEIN